ncbi:MAG: Sapep family Mn(2+)-dependent dipeptidase [Clostridiales bacterium]|nr:Sapep family Mn(2+)-dependent dipeptidase [Clostridiales bacterium]
MNLKNILDIHRDSLISSVQKLIQFKSVEGDPVDNLPFGKDVDDALRYVLDLGNEMGFHTVYKDGYYGYIEMGSGEELIGILAHLDVVPAEEPDKWIFPPFEGKIYDNKIYGRGAMDDKGPLMATLYAMKVVKDANLPLNKRIRLILGTNEETNWKGINKYIENEEIPDYGFTPDSDFPLINAEKGLLQIKLSSNKNTDFTLSGGGALNSVPNECVYSGENSHLLAPIADELNYDFNQKNDDIIFFGKSAHSARGWEGINAISRVAIVLSKADISTPIIDFIVNKVGEDIHAKNIFGDYYDDVSGKITFNIAKVNINKDIQELFVDIRIPVLKKQDEVLAMIEKIVSSYGLKMEVLDSLPSLYVPLEHPLVNALREVYEAETGQDSQPLSTGGATYARAFKNFVAFGPLFPGQEEMAHKRDENIGIDHLMKCALIYAKAIAKLSE